MTKVGIKIRAFIGIDFDDKVKEDIYKLQQILKKHAKRGRWKYIENFHLTLKFLDEIDMSQRLNINSTLEKLCIIKKPFNLTVTGMGIFNGKASVRVLWLGLGGDIEELRLLHQDIDKHLFNLGFPREKRSFKPHITIGQDIIFNHDFDKIRESLGEVEFGNVRVERLYLFKSELVQFRRVYTKVAEYPLSNDSKGIS